MSTITGPHWRFDLRAGNTTAARLGFAAAEDYVVMDRGTYFTAELRPAALCAIGDAGESQDSVEAALAGAVCELWCLVALDPDAQDPMPWTGQQLGEALALVRMLSRAERAERVEDDGPANHVVPRNAKPWYDAGGLKSIAGNLHRASDTSIFGEENWH